jgi:hypothetical protein
MSILTPRRGASARVPLEPVAGNGLLDRRTLLGRGIALAGAMTTGATALLTSAAAEPLADNSWSLEQGATSPPLQTPSRFEKGVVRTLSNPNGEPRNQHARTPHHLLHGSITPNSLHFSICHSGLPDIDPDKHRLVIHGLVRQPMLYTLEALARIESVKTIGNFYGYSTILFDFVRRAMPYNQPRTLTSDEVYALCAYLLSLNKIIGENDTMNAETLPKVKMPNRDNFIIRFPDRI